MGPVILLICLLTHKALLKNCYYLKTWLRKESSYWLRPRGGLPRLAQTEIQRLHSSMHSHLQKFTQEDVIMVFKKASDKVEALKGSFPEPPIKDQDIAHFVKARFKLKRLHIFSRNCTTMLAISERNMRSIAQWQSGLMILLSLHLVEMMGI